MCVAILAQTICFLHSIVLLFVRFMKRLRFQGGKHQRLIRARLAEEGTASSSGNPLVDVHQGPLDGDPEVDVLLELWSLGLLSATSLRAIGQGAMQVAPRACMRSLATLSAGHCHRDLARKLQLGLNDIPAPLLVELPVAVEGTKPPQSTMAKYPVLLPHEFIANMYANHRTEFDDYCLGPERLADFWAHVKHDDPRFLAHPLRKIDRYHECVIPLRIHGDAIPVAKGKGRSMDVLSVSSITGKRGPTMDWKWLVFAMVKGAKFVSEDAESDTMTQVWRVITWSLNVLLSGVWPSRDWRKRPLTGWRFDKAGQRLAGDYSFAMFQVAGDLDYVCNYLRLQHFGNAINPCFRCFADRDRCPFTDLRPTAAWRDRLKDLTHWFFTEKHLLFNSGLGLNVFHVAMDVLHLIDLGCGQHICGSIIYLLVFDTHLPGAFAEKSAKVWSALQSAYEQLATVSGERMTSSMFDKIFETYGRSSKPKDFPQVLTKGAICRHLVPALKIVLQTVTDWAPSSMADRRELRIFGHVNEVLVALTGFYENIMFHGVWLASSGAQEAHDFLACVGLHHQALTSLFVDEGRLLFHLTEKAHFVQHLALDCVESRLNPRVGWTYADEDWIGRLAQIAMACTKGRGPIRLGAPLVDRWRNRIWVAWKRRRLAAARSS